MHRMKSLLENQAFGVCTRLGEKMGVSISSIRLFFIYTSFLTLGSPVIVYLSLAFLLNMRKHLRRYNHPTVWDI
ncbi:MAG: PspC family transcriptional regulator [Cytophagales bacterium]|nr:PspC family transcriptional regulator [Cytophagales bacterium]